MSLLDTPQLSDLILAITLQSICNADWNIVLGRFLFTTKHRKEAITMKIVLYIVLSFVFAPVLACALHKNIIVLGQLCSEMPCMFNGCRKKQKTEQGEG